MNEYSITIKQKSGDHTAWIVTLYRKGFLLKRKIEVKWFNSGERAKEYVSQLQYRYGLN